VAISIQVPDLSTSTTEFDKYFNSFSVSNQSDGRGGRAYMASLTVNIPDADGNVYKQASYSAELTPALASSLKNFAIVNLLPQLRAQEKL
jgi:hypothetical protein